MFIMVGYSRQMKKKTQHEKGKNILFAGGPLFQNQKRQLFTKSVRKSKKIIPETRF